jgi:hypothetical protein
MDPAEVIVREMERKRSLQIVPFFVEKAYVSRVSRFHRFRRLSQTEVSVRRGLPTEQRESTSEASGRVLL